MIIIKITCDIKIDKLVNKLINKERSNYSKRLIKKKNYIKQLYNTFKYTISYSDYDSI